MTSYKSLIVFILTLISTAAYSQKTDSLGKKLDSLSHKTDSVGHQTNIIKSSAYNENTKITTSTYFILLGSDIKQQFLAPFTTNKKGWAKVGLFTLMTGALSFADEPIQQSTIKFIDKHKTFSNISNVITNTGGIYETVTLGLLGTYGYAFHNEKVKTTTLLATQSYITSGVLSYVIKNLTGRQRPSYYDPAKVEAEPTFRGPFAKSGTDVYGKKTNSSFPSGHATAAFAAATVYAMEYRDKPIIKIVSYGAASLIAMSRITENKHWVTDVVVGSMLGHLCGRQVVNNYHRYAKVQNDKARQLKNKLSLNMQYLDGQIVPGLVFRP
ncbi:MAG: phosphatase family protein [Sphingobacteriales bacterium]|nr:phosphatase family protein [Sphingobacteriales bacterium]